MMVLIKSDLENITNVKLENVMTVFLDILNILIKTARKVAFIENQYKN